MYAARMDYGASGRSAAVAATTSVPGMKLRRDAEGGIKVCRGEDEEARRRNGNMAAT